MCELLSGICFFFDIDTTGYLRCGQTAARCFKENNNHSNLNSSSSEFISLKIDRSLAWSQLATDSEHMER
jgi:hypothetical protein